MLKRILIKRLVAYSSSMIVLD